MGPKCANKYPCGSCSATCAFECVYCITCENWYHRQCQSMSDEELRQWGELELDYMCTSCRSLNGSRFDFVSALQRLGMAARSKDLNTLTAAVDRELLFKPRLSIPVKQHTDFPSADSIAAYIIANYVDDVYGNPITTTGDGNCLYNAISILLLGNESLATQLRYLTCIQLVKNMGAYMNHPISNELYLVSSDYDEACFDAGISGAFSNAWHLLALCDVIMRPIRSIYPNVNGEKDGARIYLNKIFYPSHPIESASPLTVLWYSIGKMPEPNVYYNVNHFAAVTDVTERGLNKNRQQSTKRKIASSGSSACESDCFHEDDLADDDNNYDDGAIQSRKQLPLKVCQLSFNGSEDGNSIYCYDADRDDGVRDDDVKEYADKYIDTIDSDLSSHNVSMENENATDHENNEGCINKLKQNGKFLSNKDILSILTNTNNCPTDIPPGPKNNVYFVIDITGNSHKGKHEFPDDCGVWDTHAGTTVNQTFLLESENRLRLVYTKNNLICMKQVQNKNIIYIPIEPQPEEVLSFHRYYTKLKGDEKFKKRVTTLIKAPSQFSFIQKLAVVEYCGERSLQINQPHGNSKRNEPYRRTNPSILRDAVHDIRETKATDRYLQMNMEDSFTAPKSSRQIQDKIYREKKIKTSEPGNRNLADDLLEILGELHTNEYVQEVILTKRKSPVIVLYSTEQILDLIKNCSGHDKSVIGIDQTFNLGKVFVTAMSYKNRSVINRKTNQYPIFLGPLCLHWESDENTYYKFFSNIREKIGDDKFIFGTDDEKALTNALRSNFCNAECLYCTKHIKDNIRHSLHKHGCDDLVTKSIFRMLFNEDSGLIFSQDDTEFAKREEGLTIYLKQYPNVAQYFKKFICQKIKMFVYKPLKNKTITSLWTNNNSESINNKLKQVADWKQHKIPELINRLYSVTQGQLIDLRRALYGSGNYKLFGPSCSYIIDETIWRTKTSAEKTRIFTQFLQKQLNYNTSNYIHSSNGKFKCIRPKIDAGKKPGQRKRAKSERTAQKKWQ